MTYSLLVNRSSEWHAWFIYSEAYRGALVAHFISSLLLRSVSPCVISSWELGEGPTSLQRSVLLALAAISYFVCACVCVKPKPTLETALKQQKCAVMPCLSLFLWKMLWPLGSTLDPPLLLAHCYPRTGDSGVGMEPSCLTSLSLSSTGVLWVISKC